MHLIVSSDNWLEFLDEKLIVGTWNTIGWSTFSSSSVGRRLYQGRYSVSSGRELSIISSTCCTASRNSEEKDKNSDDGELWIRTDLPPSVCHCTRCSSSQNDHSRSTLEEVPAMLKSISVDRGRKGSIESYRWCVTGWENLSSAYRGDRTIVEGVVPCNDPWWSGRERHETRSSRAFSAELKNHEDGRGQWRRKWFFTLFFCCLDDVLSKEIVE